MLSASQYLPLKMGIGQTLRQECIWHLFPWRTFNINTLQMGHMCFLQNTN